MEQYQHYITKNIKAFYRRRLFSPIVYLILLGLIWLIFPLSHMRHPASFTQTDSLEAYYTDGNPYVEASLNNLSFTGHTKELYGKTVGYYYYTQIGDNLAIVLLSPATCEQGLPTINSLEFPAHIKAGDKGYQLLLESLADDLEWTHEGITAQLPAYYMTQLDYNTLAMVFLFLMYYGSMLYSVLSIIVYILYICFPVLSPPCQNLIVYGNPRKLLEQAEEELATLPQLATEDMFITEHYFIATSINGTSIMPIHEILWIYKYSTLHKFLWYHFSISYTLNIQGTKHLYVRCPKNMKSDIDGIMDYLAEANHNILVGFSEANRLKVQESQSKPFHVEKLIALLRRKF